MSNNGSKTPELVGPTGMPLRAAGIVVLKVPQGTPLNKQLVEGIMTVTKCNLIVLPMEYELLLGDVAGKELEAVHRAIHSILEWKEKK